MPCYNEGDAIGDVLDRLRAYLDSLGSGVSREIIAVNDGSTDSTAEVLEQYSTAHPGSVRVVHHPQNAGLTQAMRTGADNARTSTTIFLDADLSYAPQTIGALLAAKTQTSAAVAIASPYMAGGRVGNVPFVRLAASRGANFLLSFTVGRRIRTFTGMVRAYDTEVFRALAPRADAGEFNAAMIAQILREGLGIVEVPAALIWPLSRTAVPSRLSPNKLWQRARMVLDTIQLLTDSGKGYVKKPQIGSLVLVQRPKGPYSTFSA